jgi:hypothetical protein
MPTAIVAGLPINPYLAKLGHEQNIGNWHIFMEYATKTHRDVMSCRRELRRHICAGTHKDGIHLFAFHKSQPLPGSPVANDLHFKIGGDALRVVWLPLNVLQSVVQYPEVFWERLATHLDFEDAWRALVRPRDVSHQLVLPQGTFLPEKAGNNHLPADRNSREYLFWDRARQTCVDYDSDLNRIKAHCDKVERRDFKSGRQRNMFARGYEDKSGRRFVYNGERHGGVQCQRDAFKFTLFLDDGFHYDVSDSKGGPVSLSDRDRRECKAVVGKHLNVSAYGYVRNHSAETKFCSDFADMDRCPFKA